MNNNIQNIKNIIDIEINRINSELLNDNSNTQHTQHTNINKYIIPSTIISISTICAIFNAPAIYHAINTILTISFIIFTIYKKYKHTKPITSQYIYLKSIIQNNILYIVYFNNNNIQKLEYKINPNNDVDVEQIANILSDVYNINTNTLSTFSDDNEDVILKLINKNTIPKISASPKFKEILAFNEIYINQHAKLYK